ncbi:hypothetical protein [Salipiger mucosus]|nr:hypothetical protein [Salipiger mucosus]
MATILSIVLFAVTTLLVLGNLRMVAQDTRAAVTLALRRARHGDPLAKLAFAGLWILIFALSFL